ncbi:MAG: lytic murein transglycosylase [Rhizobiaceae bacterium]
MVNQTLTISWTTTEKGAANAALSKIAPWCVRLLLLAALFAPLVLPQPASADAGFRKWKRNFAAYATRKGISKNTVRRAFKGVNSPNPEVLELARYQPEFRQKLWMYFDSRVNETSIERGKQEKKNWARWLSRIQRQYGVSANILLAIWSMESTYGEAMKRPKSLRSVIHSLSTLAYADKRRRKFARSQLIAALKILQAGHIRPDQLRGSWAGAMGHTQFIPSSYLLYGQDIDRNGKKDIWTSVPDALATAANLLKKNGWRTGKTWGYEVRVPKRLRNQAGKTRRLAAWRKLGIRRVAGRKFPGSNDRAVLKFPAGKSGPAFLMLRNFYILKRYNNSDKYALAVGHLADRIGGAGDLIHQIPRPFPKLPLAQRKELQRLLAKMGLYDKDIDGNIGSGTRAAIRRAQIKMGLNPTGFESPAFLARLRKRG